jgi:hypothetical protein
MASDRMTQLIALDSAIDELSGGARCLGGVLLASAAGGELS